MRLRTFSGLILLCLAVTPAWADCVVLLHGLARTSQSMGAMAEAFDKAGYQTINVNYPSRDYAVETLAPMALKAGLDHCPEDQTIHFVTHSLGGILVRYYLTQEEMPQLGRVVMLAPPNQGSQVADRLQNNLFYTWLNGPAGEQLGTEDGDLASQLGEVDFELGVIAGTRSINPLLSLLLPNPDDGKVAVENTKVEGMTDFIQVPHSHTFIMRNAAVIEQALHFVMEGQFDHPPQER